MELLDERNRATVRPPLTTQSRESNQAGDQPRPPHLPCHPITNRANTTGNGETPATGNAKPRRKEFMDAMIEELKRKESAALATNGTVNEGPEWREFTHALGLAFPTILRKLEAAYRFSNDVESEVTSFLGCGDDGVVGDANVVRAVKIMRAKLEAGQRLRDGVGIVDSQGGSYQYAQRIAKALAAYDKETA